jgi:hypothetical protein
MSSTNKLFYSEEEKILFWIAGYTDNDQCVNTIISTLQSLRDHFLDICEKCHGVVKTDVINKSRRYKYMRVFWLEDVSVLDIPEDAFCIANESEWTMWKWIEY